MTENKPFNILTPRLQLKGLTTADAEQLFRYRSLPEITRFQGWAPISVEEAVRFVEEEICHVMDLPDTWFQLGIFLREQKTLAGDLGMHFLAGEKDIVEIGITLAPAYQGKGLGVEAVRYVLDFLFGVLHKSKITASVDPENQKSIALVKRAGFQLEGVYKGSVLFRGVWVDDAVFTMTREQWQNRLNPTL